MQVHEVPRRPRTPSAPTAVLGAVVLGLCIPLFRGDLAAEAGRAARPGPEPAQSGYVQGTPAQAREFPPVFWLRRAPPLRTIRESSRSPPAEIDRPWPTCNPIAGS